MGFAPESKQGDKNISHRAAEKFSLVPQVFALTHVSDLCHVLSISLMHTIEKPLIPEGGVDERYV